MSNNKLSHVLVLIPLFLFLSACATTETVDPETGAIIKKTSVDLQILTDTATALVPVVKDAFSKPEQGATPASQPVSQPKSNPHRQPRTRPASSRTQPRRSSGRTSPRNNSSNNNNRSSKRSRKSSCNSNNNNQGTCR